MTAILAVLAVCFAAGVLLGLYAWLAPRAAAHPVTEHAASPAPAPPPPWQPSTEWTAQAGDEFAGLSEPARCDLVFAVCDLRDERSEQLLMHALDDPSDAVALAAAHALVQRGRGDAVSEYAERHPGDRAQRIVQTLALLG